jgi:hypothetical protein
MTRPRGTDVALLLLAAACLLFGGGLGCEPELEGTQLKATKFEDLKYVAFYGKKPPGNGWAVLEYPIVPTASIQANIGVVNPRYFQASVGAEGCVGLREAVQPGLDFRICLTYELDPQRVDISSTLSGTTAQCLGATGALLRLVDDGATVSGFYTCPGGSETLLDDIDSEWDAGEKWFHAFGGYNLGKKAEVGFSGLRYASNGPFEATPDGNIAFATFEAFRLGLDAFHEFDDDDFGGGFSLASEAFGELSFAVGTTISLGAFPGTSVQKDLIKAHKSYDKLGSKLFPDRFTGYFKGYPKIADILACALSEEEDFLD